MAFDCRKQNIAATIYGQRAAHSRSEVDLLQKLIAEQELKQGPLTMDLKTAILRLEHLAYVQNALKMTLPALSGTREHLVQQLERESALKETDRLLRESIARNPMKPISQQIKDYLIVNQRAFKSKRLRQFDEFVEVLAINEETSEYWKKNQSEIVADLIRGDRPFLVKLLEEVILQISAVSEGHLSARFLKLSIDGDVTSFQKKLGDSNLLVTEYQAKIADHNNSIIENSALSEWVSAEVNRRCKTFDRQARKIIL